MLATDGGMAQASPSSTANSRSTPSRRTAGSRSPCRASAMMRLARPSLSACLSLVRSNLRQTSSRAIDIALIASGPKTSTPKKGPLFIVFSFAAWKRRLKASFSFANASCSRALAVTSMFLPARPTVQPEVCPNPYKPRFVMLSTSRRSVSSQTNLNHLVNVIHNRN